jgi:parallel beta-helix repeat protein
MDAEEARRVLGLSSDDDWSTHESSFQAARDQMADLVRSSPTEAMVQRYQDDLMQFDRALAFYRENSSMPATEIAPPEPTEEKKLQSAQVPARGSSGFFTWLLVLLVLAGAGYFSIKEWQRREEAQRQWQIAQWESQAADHVAKRRWQEAIDLYQKIETWEPQSVISVKGRRSIEAGMLEEKEQYLAYWAGEAIAAFEGSRWEEALAAIAKVREMAPRHEEMTALAKKVRFMQTAGIRQQWKDQTQAAMDQRQWATALSWVEKILQEEPDSEQAKLWKITAEEGRKTDEANRVRAAELYQQAKQMDQGRYDPRLLEMIREAKKLAPTDAEVTALYEKIAGYTRTIRVPEDFAKLQAAFDAAQPQDRIVIAAGEYEGPFALHVPVTLEAASGEVIFSCPSEIASALTLGKNAQGAQIKGIQFRHTSLNADAERYSTVLVSGAKVSFEACRFSRAAGHGLAVISGGEVSVDQCRFEENGWNGISIQDPGSRAMVRSSQMIANIHHGIEVWNQASATLQNNRCSDNCLNGILVDTSAVVNLKGNQLTANRDYGMVLRQSGGGMAESNRFSANLLGGLVVAKAAATVICESNVLGKNDGPALSLADGVESARYTKNQFAEPMEKAIRLQLPVE